MCVLRVSSSRSLKKFLATTSLPISESHEKGDAGGFEPHRLAGFTCDFSDGFGDWERQIRDATAFLETHQDELRRLVKQFASADVRLNFSKSLIVGIDLATGGYFPASLVRTAGEIGIGLEISVYAEEPGADDDPVD